MQKLSKEQLKEIADAMDACQKQASQLQMAVEAYNKVVDPARGDLEDCLISYTKSVAALREIYKGFAGEAQEYYDNRSETWQDSDAGSTYMEWIGQLEEVDGLDDVDIDLPEDLEEPDLPDFTDVSWLPPEAPDK